MPPKKRGWVLYFNAIRTDRSGLLRKKYAPPYKINKPRYKITFRHTYQHKNEKKIRSVRSDGKITPHQNEIHTPHHTTPHQKTKLRLQLYFFNDLQTLSNTFIVSLFVGLFVSLFIRAY